MLVTTVFLLDKSKFTKQSQIYWKDIIHVAVIVYMYQFSMMPQSIKWTILSQTLEWSTWGPISESMNAAFPGWGPSTVAMMANWGTIIYMVCVIPLCWAMERFGLRSGMVGSAALMAIGTGIRCIVKQTPTFTM